MIALSEDVNQWAVFKLKAKFGGNKEKDYEC